MNKVLFSIFILLNTANAVECTIETDQLFLKSRPPDMNFKGDLKNYINEVYSPLYTGLTSNISVDKILYCSYVRYSFDNPDFVDKALLYSKDIKLTASRYTSSDDIVIRIESKLPKSDLLVSIQYWDEDAKILSSDSWREIKSNVYEVIKAKGYFNINTDSQQQYHVRVVIISKKNKKVLMFADIKFPVILWKIN